MTLMTAAGKLEETEPLKHCERKCVEILPKYKIYVCNVVCIRFQKVCSSVSMHNVLTQAQFFFYLKDKPLQPMGVSEFSWLLISGKQGFCIYMVMIVYKL